MPSEAVEQEMDANVPDEIDDGATVNRFQTMLLRKALKCFSRPSVQDTCGTFTMYFGGKWKTNRALREQRFPNDKSTSTVIMKNRGRERGRVRKVKRFRKLSLLKKSAFQWLEQATLTFKELEQAMVQSPVLALPNFEEEFIIKTNASGYEVGAILQQRGHPIAYLISAAGTKVTTVGVESLRPDWYNKVTTAERIKTAQEKIKIAYVIYVGVYSASSLVGKGQPHIVHGKPEQGGSVAPLLARDTKTESEDLLHKEVVKIRNVWYQQYIKITKPILRVK
ncbi:transposon ty3-G gag-pol polyprotein [Tanacetum coccineum]|uniref:Transposon ty3-G gag-pol polyprotein n=1 Tax=Tanacetum coccineum TaxID=301880 RepID=A0ABQ4ZEV9_9ASTR